MSFPAQTSRRDFLNTLALAAAAAISPAAAGGRRAFSTQDSGIHEVRVKLSYDFGRYYFDPIGLLIEPGQKVRWQVDSPMSHSVTAFHPANANHELRIPEKAKPFDSATMLVDDKFEWAFEEPGTYDYYCGPHEGIGMVGRVIVGAAGGPGERRPGYGGEQGRRVMYEEVLRTLAAIDSTEIVSRKKLPYPVALLRQKFPLHQTGKPPR